MEDGIPNHLDVGTKAVQPAYSEEEDREKGIVPATQPPPEDERTPAVKALVWKQDLRIVPLSAGIYLLCYLDRSNIGQ